MQKARTKLSLSHLYTSTSHCLAPAWLNIHFSLPGISLFALIIPPFHSERLVCDVVSWFISNKEGLLWTFKGSFCTSPVFEEVKLQPTLYLKHDPVYFLNWVMMYCSNSVEYAPLTKPKATRLGGGARYFELQAHSRLADLAAFWGANSWFQDLMWNLHGAKIAQISFPWGKAISGNPSGDDQTFSWCLP